MQQVLHISLCVRACVCVCVCGWVHGRWRVRVTLFIQHAIRRHIVICGLSRFKRHDFREKVI